MDPLQSGQIDFLWEASTQTWKWLGVGAEDKGTLGLRESWQICSRAGMVTMSEGSEGIRDKRRSKKRETKKDRDEGLEGRAGRRATRELGTRSGGKGLSGWWFKMGFCSSCHPM